MTFGRARASRASRPARSPVASRFTPPGTASSFPTTNPRTSTSRPATAAPPWTPTPSRSRPGPASAASRGACCACSPAGAPRSPASSCARGQGAGAAARRSAHRRTGHAARADPERAATGIAVVAEITRYPDVPDGPIEAAVLKVLGDPDDPRTEVEKVLACADVEEDFPDEVARIADGIADRGPRRRPRRSRRPARRPVHDHRSRDRARLRRRGRDRDRCRTAARGCGSRSPTSRTTCARGRRSTPRRAGAAAASTCPTARSRCCPSRCRRSICSLVPEEDRLAMVVRIDLDRQAQRRRQRLLRGGDPLARAARLPGRRGGAGRRHPRQAARSTSRSCPRCARWTRWRGSCAWRRLARGALDFDLPEPFVELDHDDPRLVRDIRKSRRDPGERQAYSMIEEFMLAANEAVARQLPRARRGHPLAHPRRARSRAAGGVRGRWPRTTASRSTSTRRARPRASSRCSTG